MKPLSLYFFGDSNLYGMEAVTFARYAKEDRFCDIVISKLKEKYGKVESVVDGKPGRSLKYENVQFGIINGLGDYQKLIEKIMKKQTTHRNVLVLSISINDILSKANAESVIEEMKHYVELTKNKVEVVIVIPPILGECSFEGWESVVNSAKAESQNYVFHLKQSVIEWKKANFIHSFVDITDIQVGNDGVHYTKESQHRVAERLLEALLEMLS